MQLRPVALGWSPRAGGSVFSAAPFSAPPRMGAPSALGQTEQQWFARAKAAVAKYDLLNERARTVASPLAREALLARYMGDARDPESALYRRNSVAYNVAEAESYTPVNYLVFQPDRVRNRVEKLEDWNRDFEEEVVAAEAAYGLLPEPVVVERIVERRVPAAPEGPGIPTAALVVGGLVLAALAFFAFGD